jgi:hypothetical protein
VRLPQARLQLPGSRATSTITNSQSPLSLSDNRSLGLATYVLLAGAVSAVKKQAYRLAFAAIVAAAAPLTFSAHADDGNVITCTGPLTYLDLAIPLAIVVDEADGHSCLLERARAGHSPIGSCVYDARCSLTGTAEDNLDNTYTIKRVIRATAADAR